MPVRPLLPQSFSGFGIELRKLRPENLPLLCHWRNTEEILRHMEDERKVSVPVLEFWLKKTEAAGNSFPFFAYAGGEPVAYMDVRNCDFARSRCEDGIFLLGSRRSGSGIASRIWLCREQVLRALGICDVFSSIRPGNERSRRFFEKMGARFVGMDKGFLRYRQEAAARHAALRRAAARLSLSEEYEKLYGDLN